MKLFTRVALLVTIIGLVSLGAFATNQATANMNVSASVTSSCTVSATGGLSFGTYNPASATDTTGTATISLQCTNGDNPTILLGQGNGGVNGSTDAAPLRALLNGANPLNYQLYTAAGTGQPVWDNATGVTKAADGTAQSITVYGTIPKGQNGVVAGTYSDIIAITVNY